ncbi:hypothetical protein OROGR_025592 [Orobanche gracilis]
MPAEDMPAHKPGLELLSRVTQEQLSGDDYLEGYRARLVREANDEYVSRDEEPALVLRKFENGEPNQQIHAALRCGETVPQLRYNGREPPRPFARGNAEPPLPR